MLRGTRYFWTGPHADLSENERFDHYSRLRHAGFDGVFLGGHDELEFEAVRRADLELHRWIWTTNRADALAAHPEWAMVSRSGKSCATDPPYVDYYRWFSPFCADAVSWLEEDVNRVQAHPLVQGVHLDYVRYPDVILPRDLWDTYGLDQTEELPDFDFDYSEWAMRAWRDAFPSKPAGLPAATDQEWIHFRQNAISQLVNRLRTVVSQNDLTAAVFPTPRLARGICRQDWGAWPLDAVFPMIYHSFYREPLAWIGDCVRENLHSTKIPVFAGLYLPAFQDRDELEIGIQLALRRGARGTSLFGDLNPLGFV